MLLNSGSPNLVGKTRDLVADPSSAPNPLFGDTEIKEAINLEYLEMRESMRQKSVGHTTKRTYANSVADQLHYSKPTDMVRVRLFELETAGRNLSTTAPASASIAFLDEIPYEQGLELYNSTQLTTSKYLVNSDEHYLIVAPPTVSGTRSIRITYEAESADLTSNNDEPIFPEQFHLLLAVRAGILLLTSKQEDFSGLELKNRKISSSFERWATEPILNPTGKMRVAGLHTNRGIPQTYPIITGFTNRS
jgi:hypothetical protein